MSVAICSLRLRPVCSLTCEVADLPGQLKLNKVVDVFGLIGRCRKGGIWVVQSGFGNTEATDRVETRDHSVAFFRCQDACSLKHSCVRIARTNLGFDEAVVEGEGALPFLELLIERLTKAAGRTFLLQVLRTCL